MSDASLKLPVIRKMISADLDRIVEIDTEILEKARPDYWELKLDMLGKRGQISALVAEMDDRVVGFIIGGASRWEYGVPDTVGWIDTIGIDPEFQRQGLAKMLFAEMTANLKRMGVETLYTFVTRRDWVLLKFFKNVGFQNGDMINLELDL
jgi:ribosomal protein S18 acetylase RimI-like enzyme